MKDKVELNKNEIRKIKIDERSKLQKDFAIKASKEICGTITAFDIYEAADVILGYYSTRNEVYLDTLFKDAIEKGKKVYLPKVISKTEMRFFRYEKAEDLAPGSFGIMEPCTEESFEVTDSEERNVLMIVPGVAFDSEGNRLGYGGGYYDRYIDKLTESTVKYSTVMAAYGMQKVEHIPVVDTDIRPDMIVSEI